MSRPLISLVEIADVICEDAGDNTSRYRSFVMRHLARCYSNLHIFVSNDTDVVTDVFPATNVINLPCDLIEVTKVGLQMDDRLVFIDRNYDETGTSVIDVNQSGAEVYIKGMLSPKYEKNVVTPFYNYKGELILEAYGHGIKCEGMYSIDRKNGLLVLGSVFPKGGQVVIEYISDGISKGVKMVPSEMYDCLYNYGLGKLYFRRKDNRYIQCLQDYDTAYYQLELLYKFVPINYIVKLFNQEMHTVDARM